MRLLTREQLLAIGDVLFRIRLLLGAELFARSQVLVESADGLLVPRVLLETTRLVINEPWVLGRHEKLAKQPHTLGVVACQACGSSLAHLGAIAFRLAVPGDDESRNEDRRVCQ